MKGIYKIGGIVVEIDSLYEDVHDLCADYVCGEAPEYGLTTTQADIAAEQEYSYRENDLEGLERVTYAPGYLETLAVYRKLARYGLDRGILLFHGSVIAVDGEAYLFTAKSGTGKSTHTRLWRELFGSRAVMINDDKPLLAVGADGVIAYGTPWNGKHRLGINGQAPLKAICILERGEVNTIERIRPAAGLTNMLEQSYRPTDGRGRMAVLELLDGILANVPLYRLRCNMDPEAAKVAYEGMKERK